MVFLLVFLTRGKDDRSFTLPTPWRFSVWNQWELSSSRESSIVRLLLFFDPGRIDFSDHYKSSMLLPLAGRRKLQQSLVFRGSIARLSDCLFTLHSADYSFTMQNSVPVVGLPFRVGSSHKALIERFSITSTLCHLVSSHTDFLTQPALP